MVVPNIGIQLEKVLEMTGKPEPGDVQAIKSPFAGTMLESIPHRRHVPLTETYSGSSTQALDLMFRCLQFNPDKRFSASEALKHPYVAEFHDPDDEPDYPHGAIQVNTRFHASHAHVSTSPDDECTTRYTKTAVAVIRKALRAQARECTSIP